MKILNIVYTFNSGGVERLIIDSTKCLSQNQNNKSDICIISEQYEEMLVGEISKDVNVFFLKRKKFRKINYLFQILKIIKDNNIDVLHIHQGGLMKFYFLIKLLKPKIKIFFTVHDTYIYSELSFIDRLISKIICRRIIAISNGVKNNIISKGVSEKKVVLVYNGVDFSKYKMKSISNIKEPICIYNVARFFPPKKGQDLLISAGKLLIEKGYKIKMYFVGGNISDIDYIEEMKQLARSFGILEYVEFLGDSHNIPEILQNADIFCTRLTCYGL